MEESRIILKSTLVEVISNCQKFAKYLGKVKDNSSLFVVAGLNEGSPSRMFVALAGAKEVVSHTISQAMSENPEIAKMILYSTKLFLELQVKKIMASPMDVDQEAISEILESTFGNKQCNCPSCKEKRQRMAN